VIIDLSAFTGTWPSRPLPGDLPAVRHSLRSCGVDRICVSPLGAAWGRNPHQFNGPLYQGSQSFDDVWPVPVLDPTVATWREELSRALRQPRVRLVRLLPNYSPYPLGEADALLHAFTEAGLAVIIQLRLEDMRCQHPLAQVADLSPVEVAGVAERHPKLTVIIGGARTAELTGLKDRLSAIPNIYADVSQADGLDTVRLLVEAGLTEKLLFGSHAPFFIPHAALGRVVTDLPDDAAEAILGGNALRVVRWEAG
jgi:predicted TIM-barrel fold metal-dependent hydrolase